jgi:hypothetical protein
MKPILAMMIVIAWIVVATVFAAEQTWTGTITDSVCGASHATMAQGVTPPLSDSECTLACVEARAKYQFLDQKANNKVLDIANQDFAGLKQHAGHVVLLTGELKGNTITVSKIEMPASSN